MKSNKLGQIEKFFYLTIIILLFQITRNISLLGYVVVLFGMYILLYLFYISLLSKNKHQIDINLKPIELIFLFSLIWIPVISLVNLNINDFSKAFPRYFITFPFILFTIVYKSYSYVFIKKVLRALVIFMSLAALSIPYQIVFGPINFFADSSFREGVVRYSSFAGSLTALGTLGGFAIAILLFTESFLFNKKTKNFLLLIIILGMLMSLQKAAIVNIVLCFAAYIFFDKKVGILKRLLVIIGFFTFILCIYLFAKETQFAVYIESLIRYSVSRGNVGIEQDLISRIWERPNVVVQYNDMNILDFLFGVGLGSLGGIMGLEAPQAHNNYFDLIFTGGILHFIVFLILLISIPARTLVKRKKGMSVNIIDRSYSMIIILVLINMMIGAGSFYQPISAVFIFFTVFSYKQATYLIDKKSISVN